MADEGVIVSTLTPDTARNLATTTKTGIQTQEISPRWYMKMLLWKTVEAGTFRVNRRKTVIPEERSIPIVSNGETPHVRGEHLAHVPLLRGLGDVALDALAKSFTLEEFNAGDYVIREGNGADKFYIIARGTVEVSKTGTRAEKLRLALLSSGDYFGEIGLIQQVARTANVQALTGAMFFVLDRSKFEASLKASPELKTRLFEEANKRVEANEYGEHPVSMMADYRGEPDIANGFVNYEDEPREYSLSLVQTILGIHTRITDLYNHPIDQLREQLRLTVESIKERQEYELINNKEFGLLHSAGKSMRIQTRTGGPTPDDMDELLSRVWKQPAFFLAHPRAIASFGRECTRRGVPPPTVNMFGTPFLTWRGVPIVPCDKLLVDGRQRPGTAAGRTNIVLMRTGEREQGVIGLHQPGMPGEQMPSLSVRFMGINQKAIASYLVTAYFSQAVLVDDALAVLENVEVGRYHDYA